MAGHGRTSAAATSSTTTTATSPCHRCFLSELSTEIYVNRKERFRLLGVVVSVIEEEIIDEAATANAGVTAPTTTTAAAATAAATTTAALTQKMVDVVLDDGTRLVTLTTPSHMIQAVPVTTGKTIEVLVRFDDRSGHKLIVYQLAWIKDPHFETLRWAQLSFFNKESSYSSSLSSRTNDDPVNHHGGSPAAQKSSSSNMPLGYPRRQITAEEIFDVIYCEGATPTEYDPMIATRGRGGGRKNCQSVYNPYTRRTTTTAAAQPQPQPQPQPRGVDLAELSLLFRGMNVHELLPLIEELQLDARVYQDCRGRYLPL